MFVQDFSKIVQPLTRLMKKREKHEWTEDCYIVFEELKWRLTSSLYLA